MLNKEMGQVALLFLERLLKMKTSNSITIDHTCFQWLIEDLILMDHNFSLLSKRPHGLMENTLSLEKF